jgi:hypothetical protein
MYALKQLVLIARGLRCCPRASMTLDYLLLLWRQTKGYVHLEEHVVTQG